MNGIALQSGKLVGRITSAGSLAGHVSIAGGYSTYSGEYEVVPKVGAETVLRTQGKLMADDVTVREIPIHRTSNESGTTVYIGKKVL